MKRIVVIDSKDNSDEWKKLYPDSEVFENIPDYESEIYIVCQDYTKEDFSFIVRELKSYSRPVIAVTSDSSENNQTAICDMGSDDIMFYPLCKKLIKKKIQALTRYNCISQDDNINFNSFEVYEKSNYENGAFFVKHDDFEKIYKYVLRLLERADKCSQALIFTIGNDDESDDVTQDALDVLSNAVQICLRRGDIFSVNGSNQVLIILMGADDDGGHLVANRILSNFYSRCESDSYVLTYDMRTIVPQQ